MLKALLLGSIFQIISDTVFAQDKNINVRAYLDPNICNSYTLQRVSHDGTLISSNLKKSTTLSFGAGAEVQKGLQADLKLSISIAYISKGSFSTRDTVYSNGSLSGYGIQKTDLSFFEATIFIEKQIRLKAPDTRLLLSSGVFYGLSAKVLKDTPDPHGKDIGFSVAMGAQKKNVYAKVDFRKGIKNIDNESKAAFKTTVLSFTMGFIIF